MAFKGSFQPKPLCESMIPGIWLQERLGKDDSVYTIPPTAPVCSPCSWNSLCCRIKARKDLNLLIDISLACINIQVLSKSAWRSGAQSWYNFHANMSPSHQILTTVNFKTGSLVKKIGLVVEFSLWLWVSTQCKFVFQAGQNYCLCQLRSCPCGGRERERWGTTMQCSK